MKEYIEEVIAAFGSVQQVLAVTALVFVEVPYTGFSCTVLMLPVTNNGKRLQNYLNKVIKDANDNHLREECQTISVTPACTQECTSCSHVFSVEAIVAVPDGETIESVTRAHKKVAQARRDSSDDSLKLESPDPGRRSRMRRGVIRVEPAVVYVAPVTIAEIVIFVENRGSANDTSFIPEEVLASEGSVMVDSSLVRCGHRGARRVQRRLKVLRCKCRSGSQCTDQGHHTNWCWTETMDDCADNIYSHGGSWSELACEYASPRGQFGNASDVSYCKAWLPEIARFRLH